MDIIKMRYLIEPKNRRFVKGYGFLSFAKKFGKNVSVKYSQKNVDSTKKSATDATKTASERAIQKTAEATRDLIGDKIADKITRTSTELHSKKFKNCHQMKLIVKYQKKDIYIYLQKKDNKLLIN